MAHKLVPLSKLMGCGKPLGNLIYWKLQHSRKAYEINARGIDDRNMPFCGKWFAGAFLPAKRRRWRLLCDECMRSHGLEW